MKDKIEVIYNEYFFQSVYNGMLANNWNVAEDITGTVWNLIEVENILVNEYGHKRISGGGITRVS